MIPQLFKTKLTAGVIAVTFCSAGVAAAATGGLPGPLQRGLDRAAQVVGHDVPPNHGSAAATDETDGDDTSTTSSGSTTSTTGATISTDGSTTSTSGSSSTDATSATSDDTTASTDDTDDDAEHDDEMKGTPVGPDATGPAKQGLCNAYMHSVAKGHSKNADAVAFRNLTEAATDAGQTVEEFCGDESPVDTGTTTASSMPSSSSSMPSSDHDDDDDDDEMTSTSAKAHGKSDKGASNAKPGKP